MPCEHVDTTMFFDTGESLVLHEHSVDTASFPSPAEIGIKKWLTPIDYEWGAHFEITTQGLCAIVGDED